MAHESGLVFDIILRRSLPYVLTNPIVDNITGTVLAPLPSNKCQGHPSVFHWVGDFPDYLSVKVNNGFANLKVHRVRQYKGFLCDLGGCASASEYLKQNFRGKSIKKIHARMRQFESRYSVTYTFHYGEIEKEYFDYLFDQFYDLLKKRFDEKKVYNRYLLEWNAYHELVYPMLLRKEASLLTVFADGNLVAIELDFNFGDVVFGYINAFDSSFGTYQVGDICMMKRLDWMIHHNFKLYDFMMGETFFKVKWSNVTYHYYYHLLYKADSPVGILKCSILKAKLQMKQFLRDTGILGKWFSMDKYLYRKMANKLDGFDWKSSKS